MQTNKKMRSQFIPRKFKSDINKNNGHGMNEPVCRYFNKMSKEAYSKYHISINKEIIYNAVFKSKILNKFLRKPEITIVDIGAGYCDLEKKLLDVVSPNQNISIIAVDNSVKMLKNSKISLRKYPYKIQFVFADANSTSIPDDWSDITFLINVIPYIRDARGVLTELYRITRANGIIVIVKPVKDRFNFWERCFNGMEIYFHENFEDNIDLTKFQIVENTSIKMNPVQDVKMIEIQIGKLIVLKVVR